MPFYLNWNIFIHIYFFAFFCGERGSFFFLGVLFYFEYVCIDNNHHLWLCLLYAKDYGKYLNILSGNSLAIQRLGLRTFTAKGMGSVPDGGTKIPQATQCSQKLIKYIILNPLWYYQQYYQHSAVDYTFEYLQ